MPGPKPPPWAQKSGTTSKGNTGVLAPPPSSKHKKKHHRSFGHWLSNVGKTVYGMGVGIGQSGAAIGEDIGHAAVDVYHHPIHGLGGLNPYYGGYLLAKGTPKSKTYKKVLLPMGEGYKHKYYDPFAQHGIGGAGLLAHNMFVEDPVGTIMDALTAATLGEAGLVKLGTMPGAAVRFGGRLPKAAGKTYTLKMERGVHEVGIGGKTGLSRRLRLGADQLAKKAAADNKFVGEHVRYARAVKTREFRSGLAHKFSAIPYWKSWNALKPHEKVAANLMHDYPSRSLLDQYTANLRTLDPEKYPWIVNRLKEIEHPDVIKAFEEGTSNEKIKTFLEESRKLGVISEKLGGTNPATAEQRRFQQALIMRGAEFKLDASGLKAVKQTHADALKLLKQSDKTIQRFEKVQARRNRMHPFNDEFLAVRDELAAANDELARLIDEGYVVGAEDVPPKHVSKGLTEQEQLTELEFNKLAVAQDKVAELADRYEQLYPKQDYFKQLGERGDALLVEQAKRNPKLREAADAHMEAAMKASEIHARIQQHSEDLSQGYSLFAKADPHIPKGHVRLYRGEGERTAEAAATNPLQPNMIGGNTWVQDTRGRWFTSDREAALRYQEAAAPGKPLLYVDVPKDELPSHTVSRAFGDPTLDPNDYLLPHHHAASATSEASIEGMIRDIKRELEDEGRPEPLYRKHASEDDPIQSQFPGAGGGFSPDPRRVIFRSKGTLAALGRVLQNVDTLTPQYLRVVRRHLAQERHARLVEMSRVSDIPNAAKGEVYLRALKTDKIGYLDRTQAQFDRAMRENLGEHIYSDQPERSQGRYHIIKEDIAKKVVGEYTAPNNSALRFLTDATDVWRALVLNLRPAWLVNNMVGNTLLYALSNAGPDGLRAYLAAVGPQKVGEILLDPATRKYVSPELMAEIMPDEVAGVLAESQAPHLSEGSSAARHKLAEARVSKLGDTAKREMARKGLRGFDSFLSGLRRADAGYERRLRQALMGKAIKGNPEIRAVVDNMLKLPEGSEARAAAAGSLRDSVHADRLAKEINRTLGDFNKMSEIERSFVRRVIPFYAWYKAITKIAFGLPVDSPYRANILWNLGKIGKEHMAEYGNPPIFGALPLPGGRILRTSGFNPFGTIPDLGRNIATLGQAYTGEIPYSGLLQPSAADVGFASSPLSPFVSAGQTGGLWHTVRFLPEVRLAFPQRSTRTYSDPGYLAEWMSYFGIPIRKPNALTPRHHSKAPPL